MTTDTIPARPESVCHIKTLRQNGAVSLTDDDLETYRNTLFDKVEILQLAWGRKEGHLSYKIMFINVPGIDGVVVKNKCWRVENEGIVKMTKKQMDDTVNEAVAIGFEIQNI